MPRINCPYCGEDHPNAAEVKSCWRASLSPPPSSSNSGPPPPRALPTEQPEPILGRSVILGRGQPPPPAWRGAQEIWVSAATATDSPDVLETLEACHRDRTPALFRVEGDLPDPAEDRTDLPVWALEPSFDFPMERLRHAMYANSVDFRQDARWNWANRAAALGATPGGPGDIILPDGRPALCDGGPLEYFDDTDGRTGGLPILHRVAIQAGSLIPPSGNTTNAELAPDQGRAVTYPRAAARIIAPAGSGKTRVLTERARHLLRSWRIPASALCLVAYNKRAAEEMKQRTSDLPGLQIYTLNSLGLAIVSGRPPFGEAHRTVRTIDEREVRDILDGLVSFPRRANTDPAAGWIEALSSVRLGLHPPGEVEDLFGGDLEGLQTVFDRYRDVLHKHDVLDFDEQIYAALELLLGDPSARSRARAACRVMLVDEFQDLTPAHLLLIRTLAGPDGFVFGVGDDDQTIYGYADASPDWLIDYRRFFPRAGEHALEVNYRCPPAVVDAARTLLTHNRRRVEKSIRASNDGGPSAAAGDGPTRSVTGDPVPTAAASGLALSVTWDPVAAAADAVQSRLDQGSPPAAIAVLTRVNSSLAPVQIALRERAIPVNRAVDESFLNRTAVAAALAWMRMALRPARLRPRDIETTLRRPPRRLSPKTIEWASGKRTIPDLRSLSSRLDDRQGQKLAEYAGDIELLAASARSSDSAGLLLKIRDDLGLGSAAAVLDRARGRLERSPHEDELNVLIQIGRLHPETADFEEWLKARLAEPPDPAGITLATVHKVKGQEWDHVMVHEATDGLMPHRLAGDEEEERRVFHVGITRCRKSVTVVAGKPESPFLAQMSREWVPPAEPEQPLPAGAKYPERQGTVPFVGMPVKDGGYEGSVEGIETDGVIVKFGAASTRIPFGKRVYIKGAPTTFQRPPDAARQEAGGAALSDAGKRAVELLRGWRSERARAEGKPAYVFLHDSTIEGIAAGMPRTLAELSQVKGIGPAKLEAWGDEILAVLDEART